MFIESTADVITCCQVVNRYMYASRLSPMGAHYSPVFGGVGHARQEAHRPGVVLGPRVQRQVVLHKVPGGHVMVPILHHAGILHTGIQRDRERETQRGR